MELNIKTLVSKKLTPNSYVYLYYLVHKMICPIPLPNVSLTNLENKGYIKMEANGKITFRKKAVKLIEGEEYKYIEPVNRVDEWIEEWRELFPKGIKTGGYYIKGSPKGCLKKMTAFIKDYNKVTKEQIFKATEKYVEEYKRRNFQYMKLAEYFISKDNVSTLYSYIEQLEATPDYDIHANSMTNDI